MDGRRSSRRIARCNGLLKASGRRDAFVPHQNSMNRVGRYKEDTT